MPFLVLLLISSLFSEVVIAQIISEKKAVAVRTDINPRIDGIVEDIWNNAQPIIDFYQHDPFHGNKPSQKTEVRILYDDKAIYIAAIMYDSSPDSILKQLGNRDERPNADFFTIKFDTYNNNQDAYIFEVSASGVQADSRITDKTFNAVWESSVKINDNGWVAELKIPFSAIRFPKKAEQIWGLQINRNIRRFREDIQWAKHNKETDNELIYWGTLTGISNVNPPLRLSFTPYISVGLEHFPDPNQESNYSRLLNGGLDLKYGINESFTLDMTLLPDFSQVQSDNIVKNLSAFETVYSEQRPFFKEAVDLFNKGDLFYSRRIGQTPSGYYSLANKLDSGETIIYNPSRSQLINSFKISGRNKNGLAVGFFNAITSNTNAKYYDKQGNEKLYLTEPLANYNIVVLDQALKNNSSVYLTNTSFLREFNYYSSNVSAMGIRLIDKTNTFMLRADGGYSYFYSSKNNSIIQTNNPGVKYSGSLSKINGIFQYGINHSAMDNNFNANDIGLTLYNNYINNSAWVSILQLHPKGKIKEYRTTLTVYNNYHFLTTNMTELKASVSSHLTTMKYLTMWGGLDYDINEYNDYYEPRTLGMFYSKPKHRGGRIGFSPDYRKPFVLDLMLSYYNANKYNHHDISITLTPIVRLNDRFSFRYSSTYGKDINDVGFATKDNNLPIFGKRDVSTFSHLFQGQYVFINDLSLQIRLRHYRSQGSYSSYYNLNNDGTLTETSNVYPSDFTFTSFTIDMGFSWQFSPGSMLNLVWKNEVLHEINNSNNNYLYDFNRTFDYPQRNIISVKAIYYLDYIYLKNK